MSESRAMVYKDGSCREVNSCSQCGNFDVYYKKDGCGFGVLTFSCAELCLMLMCDRWDERVAIIDYNSISGNCPLPDWEKVRKHSPDEHPENNEAVLLKLEYTPNSLHDPGILYRMGYVVENADYWSCFDRTILDVMKHFKSWRYINE